METRNLLKIILLALCILIVHVLTMQAQTLYSTNSKITIAPNTTLTIKGSVDNAGASATTDTFKSQARGSTPERMSRVQDK